MILTLFKIASGPTDSGVSYKELYKINVHNPFLSVCVALFRHNKERSASSNNAIRVQFYCNQILPWALPLSKTPSALLEKNKASNFSNLSAQHFSQQPEQFLMPVVTPSLCAVQSGYQLKQRMTIPEISPDLMGKESLLLQSFCF